MLTLHCLAACAIGIMHAARPERADLLLLRLAPGDPIDAYINPNAPMSPSDLDDAARAPRPRPAACRCSISPGCGGAHRRSRLFDPARGEPVLPLVLSRIGPTLLLMGTGLAIAIVVGIAAGIVGAVRRNSLDRSRPLGRRLRRHFEPGLPDRAARPLCLLRRGCAGRRPAAC